MIDLLANGRWRISAEEFNASQKDDTRDTDLVGRLGVMDKGRMKQRTRTTVANR